MSLVLTNSKNIKEFLSIAGKKSSELEIICQAIGVDSTGSKKELVEKLIKSVIVSGNLKPQAIPLSTKGSDQVASDSMRNWRKKIFAYNKQADFDMVSARGNTYKIKAHYIPCTHEEAQLFLNNQWYLHTPLQNNLVSQVKNKPDEFNYNIIRRTDTKGNQWLMLHVKTKN